MNETTWRISIFMGLLMLFCALEAFFPRRARIAKRRQRWPTNMIMMIISTVLIRMLGPIAAMSMALWVSTQHIGLLNLVELPAGLEIVLGFIALDFMIYLQHVLSHKIPLFWRFHKVHHTDRDLDASSALRFHPVEIVASMVYKCGVILLIGPAVLTVLIFEMVLNGAAMFNHANMRLPLALDKALRAIIVTPDMHRVHHSVIERETNSNYGFNFSIWDRLFRTYRAQPEAGHEGMTLGLEEHQTDAPNTLLWSLMLPFAKTKK